MVGGIDKFIQKSKERFGEKYSFPNIENEYKNSHSKITIVCNDCGNTFTKIACDHITSPTGGCRNCNTKSKRTYYNYDELVKFANSDVNIKHFDGKVYKDDLITCICNVHGEYSVKVNTILDGRGLCKKCNAKYDDRKIADLLESTKLKLNGIYGDKFTIDYSNFTKLTSRLKFTCNDCGNVVYRTPSSAINGYIKGCGVCTSKKNGQLRIKSNEEYISQVKLIHGDKYDYSNTNYISSSDKVYIMCKDCGRTFSIEANSHLQGHGCPYHYTNKSIDEEELYLFIKSIYKGTVYKNDRTILDDHRELDIVLPDLKLAFEYDGIYWHNELNKPQDYHLDKTNQCNNKGYHLIHIFEDEWKNPIKKEIWKSMIKNQIGVIDNKVFARKCEIKTVEKDEGYKFLENNHIQGKCTSTIMIGLYYNNELVSLMTFGKSRHFIGNSKHEYELLRFCNKINTSVIGGASRLLSYFEKQYKPKSIVSYADKRWSTGNLYNTLDFVKYNESKPNYYYVINEQRKNRFNFRKSELVRKYNCPEEKSEREFCFEQKWYRIYDCGCMCFEKIFSE